MLAVMLTAVLFDRAALTLRNLAISAIVVIVLSPHEVVGPSFQMSFAATAALVGAYAAWSDWRADHPRPPPANRSLAGRAVRYMLLAAAGLAVTSIVAGGATAIYAAWHFQQMPSLGLFTNLTAMPIVSVVVMPFAVLGALAMPFGLDGPFFDVMGLGLTATIAIARWFSERSPVDIVGLVPPASVVGSHASRCSSPRSARPGCASPRSRSRWSASLLLARSPAARPLRLRRRPPRRARDRATAASPSTAHVRTNSPSTIGNAPCALTSL